MPNTTRADRLVTQHLLLSAAAAADPDRPNSRRLDALCTFIDLFCLCDSVAAIDGRPDPTTEPADSPLISMIRSAGFLDLLPLDGEWMGAVRKAALFHA